MAFQDSAVQGQPSFVSGYPIKLVNYSDATYDYLCTAKPYTGITETKWHVIRVNKTTGDIQHATGATNWSNPATSLAVVAALTYG